MVVLLRLPVTILPLPFLLLLVELAVEPQVHGSVAGMHSWLAGHSAHGTEAHVHLQPVQLHRVAAVERALDHAARAVVGQVREHVAHHHEGPTHIRTLHFLLVLEVLVFTLKLKVIFLVLRLDLVTTAWTD